MSSTSFKKPIFSFQLISSILLLKSSKSIFAYCQISLVDEHEVDFGHLRKATAASWSLRDRPFNLKRGGGGYGFLFRSEICFRTTQELEYFFFVTQRAKFFPEFSIRLYDKNSESDFFFSSTKIRIFFSATLGIRIFFRKKNITPPPLSS